MIKVITFLFGVVVWVCNNLMIIADGHDDLEKLLQRFDSFNNLQSTLDFTEEGLRSRMMKNVSKAELKKLSTKECTLNNHKMGLSPTKFKTS